MISRRCFSKCLLAACGTVVACGVSSAADGREPMRIDGAEKLSVGSSLEFSHPAKGGPAILIRVSETEYLAFTSTCTHGFAQVSFVGDRGEFVCPMHDGRFDARTGQVIDGPPSQPLDRIELEIRGKEVWAVGRALD